MRAVTARGPLRVRPLGRRPSGLPEDRADRIAVYLDGSRDPLMTAGDRTFGSGRVGFGSFDNIGRTRDFKVVGTPAS